MLVVLLWVEWKGLVTLQGIFIRVTYKERKHINNYGKIVEGQIKKMFYGY